MRLPFCLLFVLALVGCGGGSSPSDGSAACPATQPVTGGVGSCSVSASCTYGDMVCDCSGVEGWYCRSTSCPASSAQASGQCSGGLDCVYGFENECVCVAPDNEWLCCGGEMLATCPSGSTLPKTGDLCCGFGPSCASDCNNGMKTTCDCNANHLACSVVSCSTNGGA